MTPFGFVLPAEVRDDAHPSGGNRYDDKLVTALRVSGWSARRIEVDREAPPLDEVPGTEPLLVDGLVLDRGGFEARHLGHRLVALLHMPPARSETLAVLDRAAAVVTSSAWTRDRLLGRVGRTPILVARPGVRPVRAVSTSPTGRRLRCVGALLPHKGQDVLVSALARIPELAWRCELVGAADLDPAYTRALADSATAAGIQERVTLAGPRHGHPLDGVYAGADVLVMPSREEHGMAAAEALACGVPVIAADTGGIREALVPGAALLVPPGDPEALAAALRAWLSRPELRRRLTERARATREHRRRWSETASVVADALASVSDGRPALDATSSREA